MEAEHAANPPEFYIPGEYTDEELEEQLELKEAEYRLALLKLKKAAPDLELCVSELVKGVPADRQATMRGFCGRGRLPANPWELYMESSGYCMCNTCCDHMIAWHCEILDAHDPQLFFRSDE